MENFKFENGIQYIKIHGLQRSGTNFVTDAISRNFKNVQLLVNVGGWKHGTYAAPMILGQEVDVLIIAKHPLAWLRSIYEYWGPNRKKNIGPDLREVAFEQFIRSPVVFEKQRGIPYLYRAANPIQYWNNMYYHYLSIEMEHKKCITLSYEALLTEFDVALLKLSGLLNLTPISDTLEFTQEHKQFEPSEENPHTNDVDFNKVEYYTKQGYLKYYSQDLLEFVIRQLDRDVMRKFGYQIGG